MLAREQDESHLAQRDRVLGLESQCGIELSACGGEVTFLARQPREKDVRRRGIGIVFHCLGEFSTRPLALAVLHRVNAGGQAAAAGAAVEDQIAADDEHEDHRDNHPHRHRETEQSTTRLGRGQSVLHRGSSDADRSTTIRDRRYRARRRLFDRRGPGESSAGVTGRLSVPSSCGRRRIGRNWRWGRRSGWLRRSLLARRVCCLNGTRRCRSLNGRSASECRLEGFESVDSRIAVGLRRFIAGAVGAVARGEKLQQRMRLIERDQLRLTRCANELLSGER